MIPFIHGAFGAGAAEPAPTNLPYTTNLKGNWDASDYTTFTYSSGSYVSQWNDKSGNGYNLTQSTSTLQPLRELAKQNGLSVVTFDSVDDALVLPSFTMTDQTVFIVCKNPSTITDTSTGFGINLASGYNADRIHGAIWFSNFSSLPTGERIDWQTYTTISGSNQEYGTYYTTNIAAGCHLYTLKLASYTPTIRLDKTGLTLTTSGMTGAISATNYPGKYGNFTFNGQSLCEVAMYSAALSDTDRNTVENYLATKWGT